MNSDDPLLSRFYPLTVSRGIDPVLDKLSQSGLADIPWELITQEQIDRVMSGEDVRPTTLQRKLAWRLK